MFYNPALKTTRALWDDAATVLDKMLGALPPDEACRIARIADAGGEDIRDLFNTVSRTMTDCGLDPTECMQYASIILGELSTRTSVN
jgi:hypothetical protein